MNMRDVTRTATARALTAAALRYDGLLFKQIGAQLGGVSVQRARDLVAKGERILRNRYAALNECAEVFARDGAKVERA